MIQIRTNEDEVVRRLSQGEVRPIGAITAETKIDQPRGFDRSAATDPPSGHREMQGTLLGIWSFMSGQVSR